MGRFEAFLTAAIGLDASSIGSGAVDRAVRKRAAVCESRDLDAYWTFLNTSAVERQQLIESIVVPETWFFRDLRAFAALVQLAKARIDADTGQRPLRLLSAPCSTGEEPYSMAMALLDAGVAQARFAIDAVDVSARAIEYARAGHFRKNSFRGAEQSFRARYFTADRLHESVRECVQFRRANLLDLDASKESARYDAIFCRNVLIYFDRDAQDRAVKVLASLLCEDGVLFVGPSESTLLMNHGFEAINWPMGLGFRAPRERDRTRSHRRVASSASGSTSVAVKKVSRLAAQPIFARAQSNFASAAEPLPSSGVAPLDKNTAAAPADLLREAQGLADRGEAGAARQCCERLLRTAGPSAPAHYLLGLLHDAAGETSAAIEHYRRVLYLDPQHEEALVHIAILVERDGDRTGALRFYERAKRVASRAATK